MNDPQNTPSVCKIFLLCVTNEFRSHREMLTKDLSLPHVKVQVQEDFVEGGHSTLAKLNEYIKGRIGRKRPSSFLRGIRAPTATPPRPPTKLSQSERTKATWPPLKRGPFFLCPQLSRFFRNGILCADCVAIS